jgi:asparagine synthase (glutamine-hydrolysing)
MEAMNEALLHRGPDEQGIYEDSTVGLKLGSRRLKIIDLKGGHMPYLSPCGRYAMVYNGEVYNYKALKRACGNYEFTSSSDGEVLFALLQQQGLKILDSVQGMFTFAFWDTQEKRLWVGRDRLGIKPLFVVQKESSLMISSEIRGLLALPNSTRELDSQAMSHYFSMLYFAEPTSIYQGIRRFPAGHIGEWRGGVWKCEPYWSLSFKKLQLSEEAWKTKIKKAFREAVTQRLVTDVPLGLLLSGGIDSTLVAQVAVQESGRPLVCHSMSFEGGEDESSTARETARQLGCPFEHHVLKAQDFIAQLPHLIRAFGEPFAGGLPLWFLCREAKKSFTVGLTGTGGDELFGNYGRVQHCRPNLGLKRALASWFKRTPRNLSWPAFKYLLKQGAPLGYFYHEKVCVQKEALKKSLLKGRYQPTASLFEKIMWEPKGVELEDRVFYGDLKTQLKDEFLYSQDILSMDHAMELRVPFLDHRLVEIMASVPVQLRSQWSDPKGWMRKVFEAELPEHVIHRSKSGFMIPYGAWLRGELKSQAEFLFSEPFIHKQDLFVYKHVQELWHRHLSGQAGLDYVLWSIFIFQMWWDLNEKELGHGPK